MDRDAGDWAYIYCMQQNKTLPRHWLLVAWTWDSRQQHEELHAGPPDTSIVVEANLLGSCLNCRLKACLVIGCQSTGLGILISSTRSITLYLLTDMLGVRAVACVEIVDYYAPCHWLPGALASGSCQQRQTLHPRPLGTKASATLPPVLQKLQHSRLVPHCLPLGLGSLRDISPGGLTWGSEGHVIDACNRHLVTHHFLMSTGKCSTLVLAQAWA